MNPDLKYAVALSRHQRIGGRTFAKLFSRYKKLENVWKTNTTKLQEAGLEIKQAEAVMEVIAKVDPDGELRKLAKYKVSALVFSDKDYPQLLKEIPDPPGLLYYKGKIKPEDQVSLAVVGSRKYTSYGREATEKLVEPLAQNGLTIVSGLALGIDAIAHQAALQVKGRTIGVLGCGLDQVYPVANIRLADRIIAAGGAIVSEYPLGMPALKQNFPVRNRIIAGLSLGTLVTECAQDSGSLLTAKSALEYNREVFAVPGDIFRENSFGPHQLIRLGAKLVTSYQDILEELSLEEKYRQTRAQAVLADTEEEGILLELLKEPKAIDQLVAKSAMSAATINATLIQLEMKGKVRNLGGTRYIVKR